MNTILKNGVLICGIAALLVFTFAVAAVAGKLVSTLKRVDATAYATRDTMDATVRIVDERTAEVVETADRHLIAAREEVQATRRDLRSIAEQADHRLAAIQTDVKATADEIVALAGTELARANDSIAEVAKIRGDLEPALENASATLFQVREVTDYHLNCRGNGACWPAGITALLGGAKVTLGESALTMRTVRKEVPNFLTKFSEGIDTANRVGGNVETFTRDITGRGHPASRVLWWGAKVKQAVPFF